jgi:uncharacterized membrane protein
MSQTDGDQQTAFREDGGAVPPAQTPSPEMKKTATGLEENVAGVLCYVLGFITGIVFLVLEKENRFVRYHAFQSIFFSVALFVVSMIVNVIPFIGWLLGLAINLLALLLWLFLMYKAYTGEKFKLPWLGDLAERQVR